MIAVVETEKRQSGLVTFQGFPLGENTSVPASQLSPQELASCIDMKFNPGGQLETREGVIKALDTMISSPHDAASCNLGGTQYNLFSDATKIYYQDSTALTEIGTVSGPAQITPYKGVGVIADGSYLKFCEDVTGVKMAYDAGTGGVQYNNYSGSADTTLSAGRVAVKFTSQAWDAGFTIPITTITAKVQESGGTASITGRLRSVADDSILAEKAFTDTVPSTAADFIDIVFTTADVTTEMSPETEYYASLEGSNFTVSCTTVASDGVAYTHGGSWVADTTKNPIMRVNPGRPPKADWTVVSGTRLWVCDPDRTGGLWYGNLSHLDFSTTNGGGWIGVIDDDRNSFEIGGAQDLYGTLYVYGTENQPYLCRLEGVEPNSYTLPLMFQRIWTTPRTLINTGSDLWNASKDGVDSLTGVQEYGDLRTFSNSKPIKDRFRHWDSTTAFAGYNPKDGQYWLYMPGFDHVSICHTKQAIRDDSGRIRYPWTRYDLPITPTFFKQVGSDFLIGGSDGYIYKLNQDQYKDLGTDQIYPEFRFNYVEFPGVTADLVKLHILASSLDGAVFDIDIYTNGSEHNSIYTHSMTLGMSDSIAIETLASFTIDSLSDVAISPEQNPSYFDLNINCRSFQIEISNINIAYHPVFFDGVMVTYKKVEA